MRAPTRTTPNDRTSASVSQHGGERPCFNRCGRRRIAPSAYCAECSAANRRAAAPAPTPGSPWCHCSTCGRTFRNLAGFDAHRPGDCVDPTTLGMIEDGGLWATPESHARAAADRARLAAVRGRTDHALTG